MRVNLHELKGKRFVLHQPVGHFALLLIIGSVVGAYVGARLLGRIPERELTLMVVAVMLVIGLKEVISP